MFTFIYILAPILCPYCTSLFLYPTQRWSSLSTQWSMCRSPASLQMGPLLRGKDSRLAPCLTPKVSSGGQQKQLTRHPNFRTAVAFVGWNISHDIRQQRGDDWMRQHIRRRCADFIPQHPRNREFYFCNIAYLKKIQPQQPNNLICIFVLVRSM